MPLLLTLLFLAAPATAPTSYTPGVGDMMFAIQMRHAKVWYAYQGRNWPLVDYEVGELQEGFADIARWHSNFKTVPRPMGEMFADFVDRPLAAMDEAAKQKSAKKFLAAYDELTNGCNECHAASAFGFNRVVTPRGPAYFNQDFRIPKPLPK